MGLVKGLATPSERMGIMWSLLSIEDAVILEYGPAGTTHHSMSFYNELGLNCFGKLFTTGLREAEVVLGDATRLEAAVIEIDQTRKPKVIFVVASALTSVIGFDVEGICKYLQKEVDAKIVVFTQGGFGGDYSIGMEAAYTTLCKKLVEEKDEILTGTYNIIGASMWQHRTLADVQEIKALLQEGLDLKLNACLCCNTYIEEIRRMGIAEVNIVLHSAGLKAAEYMKKTYGTPYIYAAPYGYEGTLEFLAEVSQAVKRELNTATQKRLETKHNQALARRMTAYNFMEEKREAVIKGDYDRVKGISRFLEANGVTVLHKICSHTLNTEKLEAEGFTQIKEENTLLKLFEGLSNKLVLADEVTLAQCNPSNTKFGISAPYLYGLHTATHMPIMGEKGADHLTELLRM